MAINNFEPLAPKFHSSQLRIGFEKLSSRESEVRK